jgi:hypothetical protein
VSFFQANSSVEPTRVDFFPGGAHGVIATKSGSYVAPLGPNGLLIVRPTNDFLQKEVTKGTEGKLHFNRAASLHDQLGTETLIFANRKNGVGLCVFSSDERPRVVLSAIAVSKTADLLWINDTSQNTDPVVIRPTHVEGAVYRALATSRHLFVLTSKALYVWFDFVNRAIAGQFASTEMVRLVLPIDAIDMYLLDDQYLFLVMGVNAVTSLAITDIEGQLDGKCATEFRSGISSGSFEKTALDDIDQAWQTADVKQQNLVLA